MFLLGFSTFMRARTAIDHLPLALVAAALVASCDSTGARILNSEEFCAGIEGEPLASGGRQLYATRAYTKGGDVTKPLNHVEVGIETVGGLPGDPQLDLRICPEDCSFADPTLFTRTAFVKTDDDGILIFTVISGAMASGLILLDFGDATCAVEVKPTAS